jgi:hypothetical protein
MPLSEVARLRKIRDFDEWVVAPRHGFAGADDYYARASVAPRLADLRLPALLVNAAGDPMVRAQAVRPFLEPPVALLEVRWMAAAGHVGFPRGLDLDLDLGDVVSGESGAGTGRGRSPRRAGWTTKCSTGCDLREVWVSPWGEPTGGPDVRSVSSVFGSVGGARRRGLRSAWPRPGRSCAAGRARW